jgi:hypothetical protein
MNIFRKSKANRISRNELDFEKKGESVFKIINRGGQLGSKKSAYEKKREEEETTLALRVVNQKRAHGIWQNVLVNLETKEIFFPMQQGSESSPF